MAGPKCLCLLTVTLILSLLQLVGSQSIPQNEQKRPLSRLTPLRPGGAGYSIVKRDASTSFTDTALKNSTHIVFGNPINNTASFSVVNMTMFTEETEMIIYSQSFVDVLADVKCSNGSVVLAFNSNASFSSAVSQWAWVDGKPEHNVILLADWPPCRVNGLPQPYRINTTVAAPSNFSITLVGQAQDWKSAVPTFDLDIGTASPNQSAAGTHPASKRGFSPPISSYARGSPGFAPRAEKGSREFLPHRQVARRTEITKRGLFSFVKSIGHAISKSVGAVVDTAKKVVSDVVNTAKKVASDLGQGNPAGAAKDLAGGAVNVTKDVVTGAVNVVKTGVENTIEIGKAIVTNIAHTGADIVHEAAAIGNVIVHVVEDPVHALTSILSPSISHTWDVHLQHDFSGKIINSSGSFLNNGYALDIDCTHCGSTGKVSLTGKIKIALGSASAISVSVKPQDISAFLNLHTKFKGHTAQSISYLPTIAEAPIPDLGFVIPEILEVGLVWGLQVGGSVNGFNGSFEFDWGFNATLSNEAIATFDLLHPESGDVHGWDVNVQKNFDAKGHFSFAINIFMVNCLALTFKIFGTGVAASINLSAPSLQLKVTELNETKGNASAAATAAAIAGTGLPAAVESAMANTTQAVAWSANSSSTASPNLTVVTNSMSTHIMRSENINSAPAYIASLGSNSSMSTPKTTTLYSSISPTTSSPSLYSNGAYRNATSVGIIASRNMTTTATRNGTTQNYEASSGTSTSTSLSYGSHAASTPNSGYPALYPARPSYPAGSNKFEKHALNSRGLELSTCALKLELSICAGLSLWFGGGSGPLGTSQGLTPRIKSKRSSDGRSALDIAHDLLKEENEKFATLHRDWITDPVHDGHEQDKRLTMGISYPLWAKCIPIWQSHCPMQDKRDIGVFPPAPRLLSARFKR